MNIKFYYYKYLDHSLDSLKFAYNLSSVIEFFNKQRS